MSEKNAIQIAAVLGVVVLTLMIIVLQPFSRFEEKYPMTVASGSAVSGRAADGSVANHNTASPSTAGTPADDKNAASGGATTIDSATGSPLVHAGGKTLETRVDTPEGFTRTKEAKNSLGAFLRNYKMKHDGGSVRLYNKKKKSNQNAHIAVFKLPLEKEDLQQCADSVMRVYAEYFRWTGETARIKFSLTDDFVASYQTWREGYRIVESGNTFDWAKSASYDDSEDTYKKFMRYVFAYAGTYALKKDSKKVKLADIRIGDVFLKAGSPGHVVMVVDMCESADGRKAFLLAQGFMPAQQFHLLKNPAHETDPWYYVDEVSFPLRTPEYTFAKEKYLRRMKY